MVDNQFHVDFGIMSVYLRIDVMLSISEAICSAKSASSLFFNPFAVNLRLKLASCIHGYSEKDRVHSLQCMRCLKQKSSFRGQSTKLCFTGMMANITCMTFSMQPFLAG